MAGLSAAHKLWQAQNNNHTNVRYDFIGLVQTGPQI